MEFYRNGDHTYVDRKIRFVYCTLGEPVMLDPKNLLASKLFWDGLRSTCSSFQRKARHMSMSIKAIDDYTILGLTLCIRKT